MRCPNCSRKLPFDEEMDKRCSDCGWTLKNEIENVPAEWPTAKLPYTRGDPLQTVELQSYTHELSADVRQLERPYYLTKWRGILSGKSSAMGFNWAAYLAGTAWIAYRKQYGLAILYYAMEVAAVFFAAIIIEICIARSSVAMLIRLPLNIFAYLLIRAPIALLANRLYLKRTVRKILQARLKYPNNTDKLDYIKKTGGTSGGAVSVAIIVNVLVNGLIILCR
jgi:hypothetical protein